jgi:hypothetical protein
VSGFEGEGPGGSPFDEHTDEPKTPTFACPKCGHSLEVGTPICGNCGTILQGGTYVPEPLAARGIRPGRVIASVLSLALLIGGFLARGQIKDALDSATSIVGDGSGAGVDIDIPDIDIPDIDVPDFDIGDGTGPRVEGARNIGQVVREIRGAGIPCSNMDVQSADEYVASGSCQSKGQHVQINIYFRPETMAFAREFYSDWAFATAHRDNWWISGDTALMRSIATGLGARFKPPS